MIWFTYGHANHRGRYLFVCGVRGPPTFGSRAAVKEKTKETTRRKGRVSLTRHADATEGARIVETRAVVLAGMGLALVHVCLASRPRESLRAVAGERARRVHANAVVLAGRSWKRRKNNDKI